MNRQQRARLDEVVQKINELRSEVSMIADEEQEKFDNLPENLQGSSRGEDLENAVTILEDADQTLSDAIDQLEEIAL